MGDVQRFSAYHSGEYGVSLEPDEGFAWIRAADHERVVAEMEQAHAAALDALKALSDRAESSCVFGASDYQVGRADGLRDALDALGNAATPRTLTADDPEPGVGSVVLDVNGRAWQRTYVHAWCTYGVGGWTEWQSMLRLFAPLTLIHDGEVR